MPIKKQGGTADREERLMQVLRDMGADLLWSKKGSRNGDPFDIECWRTQTGVVLIQLWDNRSGFEIYYPTREMELDRVVDELRRYGTGICPVCLDAACETKSSRCGT